MLTFICIGKEVMGNVGMMHRNYMEFSRKMRSSTR